MKTKKIKAGQVWNATYDDAENKRAIWQFLIVASCAVEGFGGYSGRRFIAVKYGLDVGSIYTHVFDEYGHEVGESCGKFRLERKARTTCDTSWFYGEDGGNKYRWNHG